MRLIAAVATALALSLTLSLAPAGAAAAQDGSPFAAAGPDTVQTNLWLARAMFADIVREAAAVLPPDSASVALRPRSTHTARPLFETAVFAELTAAGHEVLLDESDVSQTKLAPEVRADYEFRYYIEDVDLSYPRVGRRFGLWRRWLDREFQAVVQVTVLEKSTGRLLLDRRLTRGYADRIPARHFAAVNTPAYEFTTAEPAEGGMRAILEELVVVGALTGLVAVYFANSGN